VALTCLVTGPGPADDESADRNYIGRGLAVVGRSPWSAAVMPSDLPSSAYACTQNYVQENLDHLKKHNTFNFVS
jgi:ubiquinone biosynthesis protein COQ9